MDFFSKSKIFLAQVLAQEEGVVIEPPGKYKTIQEILTAIANFLFGLGVAIFPIVVIIVAYLFLTSGGEPKKIQQARSFLFWSSIGLAILLLSRALASLLKGLLGG